jgi:23S rRNA pseudouridine1911/1915/1917 synthase
MSSGSDLISFLVDEEAAGERIDSVVAEHAAAVSRSLAQTLVRDANVLVNGRPVKPSHRVRAGDMVEVTVRRRPSLSAQPEHIPLRVVYRDRDLAVIDKPAGLVVHPAAGHEGGTMANALSALFPQAKGVGAEERPGIVHRLDKDTSGLIVVALTPDALRSLQDQIASRTAQRIYFALVRGHPRPATGIVDAPIGRDPQNRKRMAVHGAAARSARTSYQVLEELNDFSLLEARLHTGRTHQIRVHLAALGHPLVGDIIYGGPAVRGLHRQFLHAHRLVVRSPSSGDELQFRSALPDDLERVLGDLRRLSSG